MIQNLKQRSEKKRRKKESLKDRNRKGKTLIKVETKASVVRGFKAAVAVKYLF